jgi:hypothetical protein
MIKNQFYGQLRILLNLCGGILFFGAAVSAIVALLASIGPILTIPFAGSFAFPAAVGGITFGSIAIATAVTGTLAFMASSVVDVWEKQSITKQVIKKALKPLEESTYEQLNLIDGRIQALHQHVVSNNFIPETPPALNNTGDEPSKHSDTITTTFTSKTPSTSLESWTSKENKRFQDISPSPMLSS